MKINSFKIKLGKSKIRKVFAPKERIFDHKKMYDRKIKHKTNYKDMNYDYES